MSNRKVTVLLWKKLGNPVIATHAVGWNLSEVMSTPNNNQYLDFGYLDGQVFLVGSCCGLLVSETSCEMLRSHVQWRGRRGHEVLTFLGYYRPHIRTVMTLSPNSDSAKRWIREEEDEIILDIFGVWQEATRKFRECLEWTKKNSSQKQLTQFGKSGAMGFPKVRKHPIYQPMGGEILYLTAFFFAVFFSCRSTITPGWNLGLVQDVHPTGLDSNCCGCTLAHQWAWNVRVADTNPPKNSVFPLSC